MSLLCLLPTPEWFPPFVCLTGTNASSHFSRSASRTACQRQRPAESGVFTFAIVALMLPFGIRTLSLWLLHVCFSQCALRGRLYFRGPTARMLQESSAPRTSKLHPRPQHIRAFILKSWKLGAGLYHAQLKKG